MIPEIAREAAALLDTFWSGDQVLLDILFGEFAPTGKLALELPCPMEAVEEQKEGGPLGSENPLFEFGFGLTRQG